jgi:hypothetical protein
MFPSTPPLRAGPGPGVLLLVLGCTSTFLNLAVVPCTSRSWCVGRATQASRDELSAKIDKLAVLVGSLVETNQPVDAALKAELHMKSFLRFAASGKPRQVCPVEHTTLAS